MLSHPPDNVETLTCAFGVLISLFSNSLSDWVGNRHVRGSNGEIIHLPWGQDAFFWVGLFS